MEQLMMSKMVTERCATSDNLAEDVNRSLFDKDEAEWRSTGSLSLV